MNEKVFVCAKCEAEDSISQLVTVEVPVDGWRAISVAADADGKPKVGKVEHSEVDDYIDSSEPDWGFATVTGYHCAECENRSRTLAEAVTLRREVECRECGFSGTVDDHPGECGGELLGIDPPEVNPDQVSLGIAA